eukprot:1553156-Pyramimonas_sp.AAC.1
MGRFSDARARDGFWPGPRMLQRQQLCTPPKESTDRGEPELRRAPETIEPVAFSISPNKNAAIAINCPLKMLCMDTALG